MFTPLPAKTIFEAQIKNKRDTFFLFLVLLVLYVFFFNLIALVLFGDLGRLIKDGPQYTRDFVLIISGTAAAVAIIHFLIARAKKLDDVLDELGAKSADPHDEYHNVFIHLVAEAEAASGIRPIRPVLLPTTGCNAFAVADGRGHAAIGATEGLLSRLSRSELSAVVAHEASHLVHGDSRLMTTACSLFGILGAIQQGLGRTRRQSGYSSSRGGASGRMAAAWLIAMTGYLLTRMICMAISRSREYLADEHAVQICKDPLSLAQALSKVSGKYRGGGGDVNEGYAPLFILNPAESKLDEQEGLFSKLFSTHPPLQERLVRLMGYARMDVGVFQKQMEGKMKREKEADVLAAAAHAVSADAGLFYANRDGEWFGPSTTTQLLAAGLLNPEAWVCPQGSQEVQRACDVPAILPVLRELAPKVDSKHACPRCRMPLMHQTYEGLDVLHCTFCKGTLLRAGHLERILARDEMKFDPQEVANARKWRDRQHGNLKESCGFPEIKCPLCGDPMGKMFHSLVTRVVVDRCANGKCRAVWCDAGELETLQMLVEGDSAAAGF
jgi:heat shock protein HtpX